MKKIRENTCQRKHILWVVLQCVKCRMSITKLHGLHGDNSDVTLVASLFTGELLTKELSYQKRRLINFVLNRLDFSGERNPPSDGSKFLTPISTSGEGGGADWRGGGGLPLHLNFSKISESINWCELCFCDFQFITI